MTINYSSYVTSTEFLVFTKILLRWRGSVWKVVWRELLLWLITFASLSLIYRLVLNDDQRVLFEGAVSYCYKSADQIPLTFILGFYVTLVVKRWWNMFQNIGWIDNTALLLAAYIPGTDDRARLIRRNCLRYTVLCQALIFRNICTPVAKRFPTDESMITAGLLTQPERKAMDNLASKYKKYFMPIHWAMELIRQARHDGLIGSDHFVVDLYEKMNIFRASVCTLADFNSTPIPLVYTQVVFLTVRCYFLIALIGRQFIHPAHDKNDVISSSPSDFYFPLISVIQFVFYVGWSKVAEALLNPFGDDDDDFECSNLIDRNLAVGFQIVDDVMEKIPVQEKDIFWKELPSDQDDKKEIDSQLFFPQIDPGIENGVPLQIFHNNGFIRSN